MGTPAVTEWADLSASYETLPIECMGLVIQLTA